MPNVPSKPVVQNQAWINGETKLNQTNLTAGVNTNITNLKTAIDGVIDALGGEGAIAVSLYQHVIDSGDDDVSFVSTSPTPITVQDHTDINIFENGVLQIVTYDEGAGGGRFCATSVYFNSTANGLIMSYEVNNVIHQGTSDFTDAVDTVTSF